MQGIIAHFRGSARRKRNNYLLITIPGITSKDKAKELLGKTVSWTTPGKEKKVLTGKVTGPHGTKGLIKALFTTGLPGQCLGKEVTIK